VVAGCLLIDKKRKRRCEERITRNVLTEKKTSLPKEIVGDSKILSYIIQHLKCIQEQYMNDEKINF
jgi:hypothetical protein